VPPLMYGYMRVSHDADDRDVMRTERELRAFAQDRGYDLGTIFVEHVSGSHKAFNELATTLHRADAHHVVVPSLCHFARNEILQHQMIERLEHDANAEVFELADR
jgi:DNA invertase Pin-like site-specific DNA recombinase